jgi:hypothetical protein
LLAPASRGPCHIGRPLFCPYYTAKVPRGIGTELMRWRAELASPARLCLASGAAAVIASLVTGWTPHSVRKLEFPSPEMETLPPNDLVSPDREQSSDAELFFRPSPSFQLASIPSGFVHSHLSEQAHGYYGPAAGNSLGPDATRSSRVEHNRGNLFNDAQLASIKARLKLNTNQQELWRPVESALRAIRWSRQEAGLNAHKVRSLELNSEEMKRLETAAASLIATLREDQKEEVRTLTRLMGLEQLASQFSK